MKFLALVGGFVLVGPFLVILAVVLTMWRAWWFYPAWGWFVAPLGVPQISFWHFSALLVLVGALVSHVDTHKDDRPVDWSKWLAHSAMPIVAWAVMWWFKG